MASIVAYPVPLQGHISPMLQLCYQLAASGIDVTFVNDERIHEKLMGSSAPISKVYSSGATITFVSLSVPQEDHGAGVNKSINASLVASDATAEPLEALISTLEGVTLLLTDAYQGWAQAIADKLKVPRVALWTSNVAYSLIQYHLPMLIERGYASRKETSVFDDDHLVTCIPGVEPMHPGDLPSIIHYESKEDPGFASRISKVHALKKAAWVLINSVEELERDGVEAMWKELGSMNYITVGPLLQMPENRRTFWKEDAACLNWLGKQKPGTVLYISFGSIATLPNAELQDIANALEKLQRPFLWTMRSDLTSAGADHRETIQRFVDRCRELGLGIVVEWCPQLEVLKHPATGGHLTHCGWNSVMESVIAGVPMIGRPCIAEQTMNCRKIVDWGIGLRFNKKELVRTVKKLFEEEEGVLIREKAKKFSELVKESLEPGGSSHQNLKMFIQAIK